MRGMAMLYIIRVLDPETQETYEYEYGNLKHATEHFDWETKADKVELFEYSTSTGTEKMIRSK